MRWTKGSGICDNTGGKSANFRRLNVPVLFTGAIVSLVIPVFPRLEGFPLFFGDFALLFRVCWFPAFFLPFFLSLFWTPFDYLMIPWLAKNGNKKEQHFFSFSLSGSVHVNIFSCRIFSSRVAVFCCLSSDIFLHRLVWHFFFFQWCKINKWKWKLIRESET